MADIEPNRCYACRKLFCCVDCCANHIRNKHPGRASECPLCRSEILIVRNFDNPQFLCHITINHLPLHCRACGDIFQHSSDLKLLGTCSRRLLMKKSAVNDSHSIASYTPSPLIKTPLNPDNHKKGYSIEGDFNSNFENLSSPPEFTRHTSTPMHIGVSRQSANIIFKTPRSPNFSLKTPRSSPFFANTNSKVDKVKELSSPQESNFQESSKEEAESIYLSFPSSTQSSYSEKTPLKSILLGKTSIGERHSPAWTQSESTEQRLEVMEELEENEMDLTDPVEQGNQVLHTPVDEALKFPQYVKDSGKRVRFSDQFEMKQEEDSPNKSSVTDADEFYEARQSLSEFSLINFQEKSILSPFRNKEEPGNSNGIEISESRDLIVFDNSERSEENKENVKIENQQEPIKTENSCEKDQGSGSSRVVMMVLMEKTGDAPVDLGPLIDTGLKTLKSVASNVAAASTPKDMASPSSTGSFNTPGRLSVVSVNSYTSVSSIECFEKSPGNTSRGSQQEKSENSSQGGGLFSAVANAVRTAFKNLSEVVSAKSHGDQLAQGASSSISAPVTSDRLALQSSKSLKRSREEDMMTFDESKNDNNDSNKDIRSPEQKRHRAWYRQIRGRDPIARMRHGSYNFSKGISDETQCFQQGSLSIGNTVLPLPSRAHQATQTDN